MCSNWMSKWHEIENEEKRRFLLSLIAGITFFSAWWIFIDVASVYKDVLNAHRTYYMPGIFGTIAMLIVNITPFRTSRDDMLYNSNKCSPVLFLTILFFALIISFGSFIWSLYILIADFLVTDAEVWPGIEITLQNIGILTSNLILKLSYELRDDII